MRVWIDVETGTWGNMDNLVELGPQEVDAFLDISENASDSEIIDFGDAYGKYLVAPLDRG